MGIRVALAVPEPQYAAKLARYLKEVYPSWEVAAFTQELALLRHIRESPSLGALLVHTSLLPQARAEAEAAGCRGRLIELTEGPEAAVGDGAGRQGEARVGDASGRQGEARVGDESGGRKTGKTGSGDEGRKTGLAGSGAGRQKTGLAGSGDEGQKTEMAGDASGGRERIAAVRQYQPLPELAARLRELIEGGGLAGGRSGGERGRSGPQVWTVFSAAGGAGKTTTALNLAKQAGERGWRVCYLNLEPLNATDLMFGAGEPDSLSRLLYSLQTRPETASEEWERLRRRHAWLQADYMDAPELPAERLAMPPERLGPLLETIAGAGGYDLVVVDPDSGCGDWHRALLASSDRVVWLALDDAQAMRKTDKLLRFWRERLPDMTDRIAFVLNKAATGEGGTVNRWSLPGPGPAAALPYVPQWKAIEQPGRLFQAPAFSAALDRLLDALGFGREEESPPLVSPPRRLAQAERRGGAGEHERALDVRDRSGREERAREKRSGADAGRAG